MQKRKSHKIINYPAAGLQGSPSGKFVLRQELPKKVGICHSERSEESQSEILRDAQDDCGVFNRKIILVIALILAISIPSGILLAAKFADVYVGGRAVIRIYDDGVKDPEERAGSIQSRLEELINKNLSPSAIHVAKIQGQLLIMWGKEIVCTVDTEQARLSSLKPRELADKWAKNLRWALRFPLLKLSKKQVVLPVKGEDIVAIDTSLTGETGLVYDSSVVDVKLSDDGQSLRLKAQSSGKTKVTVERASRKVAFNVIVKDWAGKVPDRIEVAVKGNPAPSDVVEDAALHGAAYSVVLQPGCQMSLREKLQIPQNLPLNDHILIRVPVVVEGPGYFTVEKTLEILVKNEQFKNIPVSNLMVSNRPESIDRNGILYQSSIANTGSVRLLYSHKNISHVRRNIKVKLINISNRNVKVLMNSSLAGPDRQELTVGHRAAYRFMNYYMKDAGFVMLLQPGMELYLVDVNMAPHEVVSGIASFQIVEGEKLEVVVETTDNGSDSSLPMINEPFNPFLIHPRGNFPNPDQVLEGFFLIGGGDAHIDYGKGPWLIDAETGEPNTGNYGAIYEADISLENPSPYPRQVQLLFSPFSGPARGTFIVDGALAETPILKPGREFPFYSIDLGAGEKKKVKVYTMPEAGSNYPSRIVVREVNP
ncbi:MAG: hypothetical protein M1536_01460 [Firmicutes bacterium]|nr:hypothetical protein [Bacillota bacterium]